MATVICGCGSKEPVVHNPVTAEGGSVSVKDDNGPKIEFKETEYDFGTVMQGERLSHTFVFTNTGKSDLIISSAHASCGCTTSTPPKAPIRLIMAFAALRRGAGVRSGISDTAGDL